jgi:hypothetical protein
MFYIVISISSILKYLTANRVSCRSYFQSVVNVGLVSRVRESDSFALLWLKCRLTVRNKTVIYRVAIIHRVCICFRAGLPKPSPVCPDEAFCGGESPTPNEIKIRKRWITRQPRLTQIHCWLQCRQPLSLMETTSIKSLSPLLLVIFLVLNL